jgi:hypothetical protein
MMIIKAPTIASSSGSYRRSKVKLPSRMGYSLQFHLLEEVIDRNAQDFCSLASHIGWSLPLAGFKPPPSLRINPKHLGKFPHLDVTADSLYSYLQNHVFLLTLVNKKTPVSRIPP